MIVFKLERERPASCTSGGSLYYVKDRHLRCYDFATERDNPLIVTRRFALSLAFGTVSEAKSACRIPTNLRLAECVTDDS